MPDPRPSLAELEQRSDFVRRHLGPGDDDIAAMLETLGLRSLDGLLDKAVPKSIRAATPMDLPEGMTEAEVLAALGDMTGRNRIFRSMIGMGYHDTFLPPVILRNVLENPGWYTAYTPYQPEIAQGRLEALLNFQTMVMDMTGMDLANASLLDEATAAAEAMAMCHRVGRADSDTFFVAADCHPQTVAVVRTRARALGFDVAVGDPFENLPGKAVFGALLQYPATTGEIHDYARLVDGVHERGGLVVVASDLLALALLAPPGEWGADVVVGNSQRFGVPMGFGGPHAAFFATRESYKRSVPGRLVGVSVDTEGRPALRLALQTREQHIRREKATSNICTAQVLLANISGFYAVWHGPDGIRTIAERVHRLAGILASGLDALGFALRNRAFFDTLAVDAKGVARDIIRRAAKERINLRLIDRATVGVALDETTTAAEVEAVLQAFAGKNEAPAVAELEAGARNGIPARLARRSPYLTESCFSSYRSETAMMRYLRRLQEKDIALDRSMIPLGSCTMKLNAATEMTPITWKEFGRIHPYAPDSQVKGYRAMIDGLEEMLCRITGFAAVSLQPNAGSQGEYSGLLAIRRYHESRGEKKRRVCLIPSSAHGTNPASATMAGLRVEVVECDDQGNIDVEDLAKKADEHGDDLAALMVTYPSTHGVYEEKIVEVCRIVHDHGGQVYLDGANLNALVGNSRPGEWGADVAHLNLHKTFCIPHGGGGPGVGPIGVVEHLAPFLPGHPLGRTLRTASGVRCSGAPVSAAPWGSASILPISWAYIALMGRGGLEKATRVAILNANYIAKRLAPHYPVLYTGPGGFVAHECIVDLRPLKHDSGVEVDDVAKRLMDYGFHAPTMSFPVPGTLMIEPTESESKEEIDRFCDAMIAIREEIGCIESGEWDREDNPLRNAPHTADEVMATEWTHPYSREVAAFPAESLRRDKYWPPVSRIDQVYGDRHLVCSCAPIDAYREAAE